MPKRRKRSEYLWVGGKTCLDFSNTQSFRPTNQPLDRLESYDYMLDWAGFAEILGVSQQRLLGTEANRQRRSAKAAWKRAIALREAIYRLCSRYISRQRVQSEDVQTLNQAVAEANAHRNLVVTKLGFRWKWQRTNDLRSVFWPIALSAVELLASDDMGCVRECSLETCSALFLDSSKNKKRRWCDMKDCGNLAKARTFRAKRQSMRETS